MSTALTDTITWGHTAPSTIDVYFLSDGTGTGELNFASFTDVNGNTFDADAWTTYEQQQALLAFEQFAAVADVTFNFVTDISQADFVMVTGSEAEVGSPGYWNVGGGTITVDGVDYGVDGVGVFNWQGPGWDSRASPAPWRSADAVSSLCCRKSDTASAWPIRTMAAAARRSCQA